ncbi:MAG: glycosyltransferase family 1 protein, partial [Pleurocapsa sp. SU_196_0]|nr:glycosyltransferase family 1 protein [Pleurocapsa sp. SU_196_0]
MRLSRNIWWSWNPSATELFERISPSVWSASNHNPVRVLRECTQADLNRVSSDKDYLKKLKSVLEAFDAYMTRKDTWFKTKFPAFTGSVAYFSMEYGFHESFQIYSGGLGVLAGDHCKSASDLDVPFNAVGLLYREGYFHQQLDASGWQFETFQNIVPDHMPLELVTDANGNAIKIGVEVSGRTVTVQAWRLGVGRINVYLLDSNVPENSEKDRFITAQLYDSGRRRGVSAEELRVAIVPQRLAGLAIDAVIDKDGDEDDRSADRLRAAIAVMDLASHLVGARRAVPDERVDHHARNPEQ